MHSARSVVVLITMCKHCAKLHANCQTQDAGHIRETHLQTNSCLCLLFMEGLSHPFAQKQIRGEPTNRSKTLASACSFPCHIKRACTAVIPPRMRWVQGRCHWKPERMFSLEGASRTSCFEVLAVQSFWASGSRDSTDFTAEGEESSALMCYHQLDLGNQWAGLLGWAFLRWKGLVDQLHLL